MLPYLPPFERLMVALRRTNLGQWFRDFLADPVDFLIRKGAKKVILVGGREPSPPEDVPIGRERSENEGEKLDLGGMPPDESLRKEVLENDSQLKEYDNKELFTKKHGGYAKAKGIWLFRFFNCIADDSRKASFIKCVRTIIQTDDVVKVIKNKQKLQLLRRCYKSLRGDFNNTSLLVYHAPIALERLEPCYPWNGGVNVVSVCLNNELVIHPHGSIGQFLTGDINLNRKLAEIEIHYSSHLSKIGLALVPHHGSRSSWNGTVLNKIPKKCSWVTSAGVKSKYHPSPSVIQDIIQSGSTVFKSNELNEISVRGLVLA
jgi:hypothetical protein